MIRDIVRLACAAALLWVSAALAFAQVNMQPLYTTPISSAAATNRNKTDNPVTLTGSDLRVVPENFAALKLAPGFLVRLTVLDDSDYTGEFRIDQQGNISVPVLGVLHIAGETSSQARDDIARHLLEGQILKDPQVILTVLEYTAPQVTIIGEVAAPGKYPLLVSRNLVDVLAIAGGPTN